MSRLSTMTIMLVLPLDDGSPVMKSMEKCDQGLQVIERGWSNPRSAMRDLPLIAYGAGAYKGLGILLDGHHQNRLWRNSRVQWMAVQTRGVTPLENLGANSFREKQ